MQEDEWKEREFFIIDIISKCNKVKTKEKYSYSKMNEAILDTAYEKINKALETYYDLRFRAPEEIKEKYKKNESTTKVFLEKELIKVIMEIMKKKNMVSPQKFKFSPLVKKLKDKEYFYRMVELDKKQNKEFYALAYHLLFDDFKL